MWVDDDIDISDARQIVWAMATRYQPAEDSIVKGGRMVVDARKGDGWTARRATLPTQKSYDSSIEALNCRSCAS